jgi:hypothetical protein
MNKDARPSDPARVGEEELLTPSEAAAYLRASVTSTSYGSTAADRDSIARCSEASTRIAISGRP